MSTLVETQPSIQSDLKALREYIEDQIRIPNLYDSTKMAMDVDSRPEEIRFSLPFNRMLTTCEISYYQNVFSKVKTRFPTMWVDVDCQKVLFGIPK
jgi:hypothetical protein